MFNILKKYFIYSVLVASLLVMNSGCGVGSGCPAQQADSAKFDRKGKLKSTGGKTRLFPKNTKK